MTTTAEHNRLPWWCWLVAVAIVGYLCWHGLRVDARQAAQVAEMERLAAQQRAYSLMLYQHDDAIVAAGTVILAARVVSDDRITRAQETARATGVPMWDHREVQ